MLACVGNGFIRVSLACKFCRQRELGFPAEQLFDKKNFLALKSNLALNYLDRLHMEKFI
jgi:hypothetical protein